MYKITKTVIVLFLIFFASQKILAATNYVSKTGGHISPFDSWANAATNIQNAVDVASAGDTVLVNDGTYYPDSQISVTKNIIVKSVNGAENTIVDGSNTNRCFYLQNKFSYLGPTIDGFTITKGYAYGNYPDYQGGGVYCQKGGLIKNCNISRNSADKRGAGVFCSDGGTIQNCTISGNSASYNGGGVICYNGTIQNCTISGNSASYNGGASCINCTVHNSIIYYNDAIEHPNYYIYHSTFEYNCTIPLAFGNGNISDSPILLDSGHIASNSPCVGAGNINFTSGSDIDGDSWVNPPAIGCDQPVLCTCTGQLSVSVSAKHNKIATGYSNNFYASVLGQSSRNQWSFDNGDTWQNTLGGYYSWNTSGVYKVILTAFNDTYPAGVSATLVVEVVEKQIYYVDINNVNPVSPYISWVTAATNIQPAIDNAIVPGDTVLVNDGFYYPTDQIYVTNNITVKSVNGAEKTIVDGNKIIRCFYLNNGSIIDGFTITNGNAHDGGGVHCKIGGIIQKCIISGNSASNDGGGIYCEVGGTIRYCAISGNSASDNAGGVCFVFGGTVQNCIISGNFASDNGGGVDYFEGGTIQNCTISENLASNEGGGLDCRDVTVQNCTITGNFASNAGGGVLCDGGTVQDCTISGNSTSYNGGGMYCEYHCTVQNSIISGNSASNDGGGVYCSYSGSLLNCTIIGNSAFDNGGGVYCYNGGTVMNSILWNNTDVNYFSYLSSNLYNCIENWTNLNNGIITNNPEFVDAASGNYRLESFSPCINVGTNMSWMWTATDLDGNPRLSGGTVDMGAYEYLPEPGIIWIVGLLELWIIGRNQRKITK